MAPALLQVRDLRLERGGRALLTEFDLDVLPGQMVLVEGANGSGKTTLLRALAGLSTLGQEGSIERSCRQLLFLGHKPGVKQLLTARENLAWYCQAFNWDEHGIDDALERVGLYGYEDVSCQQMSAGQQRRVNLARLYLSDSDLCLLDEPFTAIDREGVKQLAEFLAQRAQAGAAVILTSHQDLPVDVPVQKVQL